MLLLLLAEALLTEELILGLILRKFIRLTELILRRMQARITELILITEPILRLTELMLMQDLTTELILRIPQTILKQLTLLVHQEATPVNL